MKIICWFSCGAASAVATKIFLNKYSDMHDIRIVRIFIEDEHEDNERFAKECELWYGREIEIVTSKKFNSCQEVWETRRYMSGIKGAPCTTAMKSDVRREYQISWKPDLQVFGFTAEEKSRADRFRANNPEVGLIVPLITEGLTKNDCFNILAGAHISLPKMYDLGFRNNNCIGCVKSTSVVYWQKVRKHFPEVYARRCELSRDLGVRLIRVKGVRVFLDELPFEPSDEQMEEDIDCSILCITEQEGAQA